jgi:hypothetical protein
MHKFICNVATIDRLKMIQNGFEISLFSGVFLDTIINVNDTFEGGHFNTSF